VAIGVHVVVSYFFWTPVHVSRARLVVLAHARVGGLFGAFDGEILSPTRKRGMILLPRLRFGLRELES
jgi:hypothetical protein